MHKARTILTVLAIVAGFAALGAAEEKADPREKLETAIPEAIRLLEAKEYENFLKAFVAPDDMKKIAQEGPLVDFAKRFGEAKAADLLLILKSIKGKKPALDAEEKKATFKLEVKSAAKDEISFVKVEKFWYIQN